MWGIGSYSAFQIDEPRRHNQNPVGANGHSPLLDSGATPRRRKTQGNAEQERERAPRDAGSA